MSRIATLGSFAASLGSAPWLPSVMWSDEPIGVPLLALLVEQPTWNSEYKATIEHLAPQLDWVMWQDVSHFLMLERPAEFQTELIRFLAAVG